MIKLLLNKTTPLFQLYLCLRLTSPKYILRIHEALPLQYAKSQVVCTRNVYHGSVNLKKRASSETRRT